MLLFVLTNRSWNINKINTNFSNKLSVLLVYYCCLYFVEQDGQLWFTNVMMSVVNKSSMFMC